MVQWFTTSPLHGEDPEFEPRLDHIQVYFFFSDEYDEDEQHLDTHQGFHRSIGLLFLVHIFNLN